MDFDSDDGGFAVALSKAEYEQAVVAREQRGNWWATQEVTTIHHTGSDKFKRNLTRIVHLTWYMKKIGWINEEQYGYLKYIMGITEVIFGGLLGYYAIINMRNTTAAMSWGAAAAETGFWAGLGPPGWARIAFAIAATTAIIGSGMVAYEVGQQTGFQASLNPHAKVTADYNTFMGRRIITLNIHALTRAGRVAGGM